MWFPCFLTGDCILVNEVFATLCWSIVLNVGSHWCIWSKLLRWQRRRNADDIRSVKFELWNVKIRDQLRLFSYFELHNSNFFAWLQWCRIQCDQCVPSRQQSAIRRWSWSDQTVNAIWTKVQPLVHWSSCNTGESFIDSRVLFHYRTDERMRDKSLGEFMRESLLPVCAEI